jgi:hypothetical protein
LQSARGFGAEGDGAFAYFSRRSVPLIVELIEAPRVRIEPEFVYPPQAAELSAVVGGHRRGARRDAIETVEAIPAGSACYVRVTADDGTTGVGESTFFGWPTAVAEIVRSFGDYLKGRDALDVEHHWLALYRAFSFRGMAVTGAISAIDQALWDLKGKHFEVPVWQLLGGRARARCARCASSTRARSRRSSEASRGRRG